MGPLVGLRVIEFAGLGPTQFAGMVLADLGADVIKVERATPVKKEIARREVLNRGRRSVVVDVKLAEGVEVAHRLIESADVLIEGFRPGVMERLGLGPDQCLQRNPRLVYARATGWGQIGPASDRVGHDVNYLALSGVLSSLRRAGQPPQAPLNLVADIGGGGMLALVGVLGALWEVNRSGVGQVVDAAMVDGCALLATSLFHLLALGQWSNPAGNNIIDTGAPFYEVYATADGEFMAVGAIEPHYYARLLEGLGLTDEGLPDQMDQSAWPTMKARFADAFGRRDSTHWHEVFRNGDACVTPVVDLLDAPGHPDNEARKVFLTDESGVVQPAPAPRFSRTVAQIPRPPSYPGEHTDEVLLETGWGADEIGLLREKAIVH